MPSTWRAAARSDVATHDRVLSELVGRAVVPLRFGTVVGDDDELHDGILTSHAEEFSALLDRVDGRVQMSVKAYYRDEALLRAVLARRPDLKPEEVIDWARSRMAAFKVPRIVQFVDALPKTATGKILWRELQERERAK